MGPPKIWHTRVNCPPVASSHAAFFPTSSINMVSLPFVFLLVGFVPLPYFPLKRGWKEMRNRYNLHRFHGPVGFWNAEVSNHHRILEVPKVFLGPSRFGCFPSAACGRRFSPLPPVADGFFPLPRCGSPARSVRSWSGRPCLPRFARTRAKRFAQPLSPPPRFSALRARKRKRSILRSGL